MRTHALTWKDIGILAFYFRLDLSNNYQKCHLVQYTTSLIPSRGYCLSLPRSINKLQNIAYCSTFELVCARTCFKIRQRLPNYRVSNRLFLHWWKEVRTVQCICIKREEQMRSEEIHPSSKVALPPLLLTAGVRFCLRLRRKKPMKAAHEANLQRQRLAGRLSPQQAKKQVCLMMRHCTALTKSRTERPLAMWTSQD